MAETTKIAWCDATFNPWIGCTKCSPGCDNCYAERDFGKRRHFAEWGEGKPRRLTSESNWKKPIQWNRKCHDENRTMKVFCGSLCDVFGEEIPLQWRYRLFELIMLTPNLTWLLLTKRASHMKSLFDNDSLARSIWEKHDTDDLTWPLKNLWLGVTACNQGEADEKIPILLETPAVKRFVSIEPMLDKIDVSRFMPKERYYMTKCESCGWIGTSELCGSNYWEQDDIHCPKYANSMRGDDAYGLDWMIAGGETGTGARHMNPEWARAIRDQCKNANVPFFFKQMTNKAPIPNDLEIQEIPD